MRVIFCIVSTSSSGEYKVAIEVKCKDKPQIRVGDHFVGVSKIEDFDIIADKSSENWRERFLVGPSPYKGISVYGNNPEDLFYFDLPETIKE